MKVQSPHQLQTPSLPPTIRPKQNGLSKRMMEFTKHIFRTLRDQGLKITKSIAAQVIYVVKFIDDIIVGHDPLKLDKLKADFFPEMPNVIDPLIEKQRNSSFHQPRVPISSNADPVTQINLSSPSHPIPPVSTSMNSIPETPIDHFEDSPSDAPTPPPLPPPLPIPMKPSISTQVVKSIDSAHEINQNIIRTSLDKRRKDGKFDASLTNVAIQPPNASTTPFPLSFRDELKNRVKMLKKPEPVYLPEEIHDQIKVFDMNRLKKVEKTETNDENNTSNQTSIIQNLISRIPSRSPTYIPSAASDLAWQSSGNVARPDLYQELNSNPSE